MEDIVRSEINAYLACTLILLGEQVTLRKHGSREPKDTAAHSANLLA